MIKATLTEGNLFKRLIIFALPFLLSNILQAIYGVVDLAIVSKYCTQDQITAVNVGSQIMITVTNVLIGFSVGISVLTALFVGKGDSHRVGAALGTMLSTFVVLAGIVAIALFCLAKPILVTMNVDASAMKPSYEYLSVSLFGIILILVYNIVAGMQRGAASTKPALVFTGVSGLLNLILDIHFVKNMQMGAKGAAIATVIAQGTACTSILILLYFQRKKYSVTFKSFKPEFDLLKKMVSLGTPAAIQQLAIQLSFLVLMTLVNSGGMSYTNAYGYVAKISSFAILPYVAIMSAISAVAGQSIGRGKLKRATNAMWAGIILMAPLGIITIVIANLYAPFLIGIFTTNEEVLPIAVSYLRVVSFEYIVVFAIFGLHGFLTSAGKTLFIMINSFISSLGLRIPLALILYPLMGINGIALSIVLSPILSTLVATIYFFSGKWKPREFRCKSKENHIE